MSELGCRSNEGRLLVFADTPLQLMNSITLAHAPEYEGMTKDLVVLKQFEQADSYIERVGQTGVFETVASLEDSPFSSRWDRRLRTYRCLISKTLAPLPEQLEKNCYSVLALSCPTIETTKLLKTLRAVNPRLEVVFYEDGSGSYTGNVLRSLCYLDHYPPGVTPGSRKLEFQRRLLHHVLPKVIRYNPKVVFLYRPELVTAKYGCVERLRINSDIIEVLQAAFDSGTGAPNGGSEIVLFDIARGRSDGVYDEQKYGFIIGELSRSFKGAWIKSHPRTLVSSSIDVGWTAYPDEVWEIGCATRNINDWTLVGIASSAMITPVFMYGEEPNLVFLHEIDGLVAPLVLESCRAIYDIARRAYSDSDKIIAPRTLEDLLSELNRLKVRNRTSNRVRVC